MTAIELFDAALEHLQRGNEVGVAEMLKAEAVANAALIEEQITAPPEGQGSADEQVQVFLQAHDEANERLLAVAFPAIEYGGDHVLGTLKRAVSHVVRPTAETRSGSALRPAVAIVVVGGVLWALATYALACDRTDAVAYLGSITIYPPDDREGVTVFARREFRYPHALGDSAGNSFEHYRTWLGERAVIADRTPLFAARRDEDFAEADLLLALRMIATMQHRTYSGGARPETVRRLASRFRDVAQRPGLASLFNVHLNQLDEFVEACYRQHLEYDRDRVWGSLPPTFVREETGA